MVRGPGEVVLTIRMLSVDEADRYVPDGVDQRRRHKRYGRCSDQDHCAGEHRAGVAAGCRYPPFCHPDRHKQHAFGRALETAL